LIDVSSVIGKDVPMPKDRTPRSERRRRHRRLWPVVVPLVVVAVAVSLLVPASRHQWAESVIRQPSPYSSLAFVDPTGLPTAVASGQTLHFSFTIGNHESRSLVYQYFLKSSPSKVTGFGGSFGGGSVAVPADQSRSVTVSADPECSGSPCRISVILPYHAEAVDFNIRVTGLGVTGGHT
jgi:hypothetical protein